MRMLRLSTCIFVAFLLPVCSTLTAQLLPRNGRHAPPPEKTAAAAIEEARSSEEIGPVITYPFALHDLPALYEGLRRSWPDDDQQGYTGRKVLLKKLRDIHDSTTAPFLAELYPSLHSHPSLQMEVLGALAAINTQASIPALAEIFRKQPVPDKEDATFFHTMRENRAHVRALFPAILSLIDSAAWQGPVYSLFITLLDSHSISTDDLWPARERILVQLRSQIAAVRTGSSFAEDEFISLSDMRFYSPKELLLMQIAVAGAICARDTETAQVIRELLPDSELAPYAATALLRNGQTLPAELIDSLAADAEGRLALYTHLAAAGRTDLLPRHCCSQALVTEAFVASKFEFASCQLVATREITTGPRQGRYFLFGLRASGDLEPVRSARRMAIAYGPQPFDTSQIVLDDDRMFTMMSALDENDVDADFNSLLQFMTAKD